MRNNIFYLHPAKCGGSSVASCLRELDLPCLFASQISLDDATVEALTSSEKTIFHGHITDLPTPLTHDERRIYSDILRILYYESDLIVPTRNPSNLLQSWMHYTKTRATRILDSILDSRQMILNSKEIVFLYKISQLRQKCAIFNEYGVLISKGEDFPIFGLSEKDEEENLNIYIDFLASNKYFLPELCSMQFQAFRLKWRDLSHAILKKHKYLIKPPLSSGSRQILYYDCEKINESHQKAIDNMTCEGFSRRLSCKRENQSFSKPGIKGCEFSSVNKKLKRLVPGEWALYAQSEVV
ncbi:hypothetical protein Q3Y53_02650 [Synechococcus sp. YX-04-1]|uniref:hypothetical protein n=1 Tax=Synechococcus sp. YX-04-1 TaxID=3062778 RepID=UPI0026E38053|nr:hypothetical protein [Synechococcus sp. YX-04-1]MDO6351432.1 hypothetical protein [Synechococcus sp. YX-04-1]